jgi:hypothetical protein
MASDSRPKEMDEGREFSGTGCQGKTESEHFM